jgi:hypothetical protein
VRGLEVEELDDLDRCLGGAPERRALRVDGEARRLGRGQQDLDAVAVVRVAAAPEPRRDQLPQPLRPQLVAGAREVVECELELRVQLLGGDGLAVDAGDDARATRAARVESDRLRALSSLSARKQRRGRQADEGERGAPPAGSLAARVRHGPILGEDPPGPQCAPATG